MGGAEILMDRPPAGWSDLVTNHTLKLRFAGIDHGFDRFEHELLAVVDQRSRAQIWVSISTIIAAMGIVVAAVRW